MYFGVTYIWTLNAKRYEVSNRSGVNDEALITFASRAYID